MRLTRKGFLGALAGLVVAPFAAKSTVWHLKNGSTLAFKGAPFVFDKPPTPLLQHMVKSYNEFCKGCTLQNTAQVILMHPELFAQFSREVTCLEDSRPAHERFVFTDGVLRFKCCKVSKSEHLGPKSYMLLGPSDTIAA